MQFTSARRDWARPLPLAGTPFFALVIFFSAFLVFLVEPLAGKLILPLLGGAPAVWNTALAFFQLALLAGYAYAHALQRHVASLKRQWLIHLGVLGLALFSLPLGLTARLGPPDAAHPALWVMGVLTLSIGAPFVALSATAPLVQAWFARTARGGATGEVAQVYALYAASNLGSLVALIAYPALIEPVSELGWQRLLWSAGFAGFAGLIAVLGLRIWGHEAAPGLATPAPAAAPATTAPSWAQVLGWIALAAAPSSLLLGVTTHLAEDVASAPFLWVAPLALYLFSFVLAFSARRVVGTPLLLTLQALAVLGCVVVMPISGAIGLQLEVHLGCFFFTAWMCHQILASQQPDARHLTLYYLCLSIGGVVGGSFNAFVAPVLFDRVLEYPLVLMLALLARPFNGWRLDRREAMLFGGTLALLGTLFALQQLGGRAGLPLAFGLLGAALLGTFLLRRRGLYFAALVTLLLVMLSAIPASLAMGGRVLVQERSFFGVLKVTQIDTPDLGPLRLMLHGTTTHGAQAVSSARRCLPLTYYGLKTGIGRTMLITRDTHPALDIGVIGLGVGTLATYLRPQDRLTYYEIDPLVARRAADPALFGYLGACAQGRTAIRIGDGRLSLNAEPHSRYDLLVVDAFSSDSVPAHLLTVEAVRLYFRHLKPGGIVLFHISNRHLALAAPVTATVRAAGGAALHNIYYATGGASFQNLSTEVILAAPNPAALAAFAAQPGFAPLNPGAVRPWTDNYTNLLGALLAKR